MSDLSFDIKTTSDFFKKLTEDYNEFLADKISSRVALNCAMTAWHLTDWAYNEFNNQLTAQFGRLDLYQEDIKDQCPSLQIMHDLSNGTKHYLLTRHSPKVKKTTLHRGSFNNDFNRDFDISSLDIALNNGTKIYFEDEIQKVVEFWAQYLKSTFNLII
jgi:hypothetical protein